MRHPKWTSAASTALVLISAVALAGCGDDSDSGSMPGMNHGDKPATSATGTASASAGEHNDADVDFATHMIPHHQQAIQMANMAGYLATTAEVKKLATSIKAAQDPEIKQLTAWLVGWGEPVPTPDHGGHGGEPMPGMMTEDEMSDLGNADGSAFDRMWTQLMIKHHEGAVAMAKTEQSTGKNATAIELAKKIETSQTKEIATLKRLLGQIPAG
ncbi:DUF305 domain-containing protein [Kribbella sancticallisti]|uniref:DUF305 domain-containing protein n=1 Tax=Kribbella sancticallisti TaxID=460087 RepID=A0ABP4Q3S3_9ACTN